MKSVFIVGGAIGEYSDHREWPVAAFFVEAEAEAFVKLLEQKVEAWVNGRQAAEDAADEAGEYYDAREALKVAVPEDPYIDGSFYDGPSYGVYEVPLKGSKL